MPPTIYALLSGYILKCNEIIDTAKWSIETHAFDSGGVVLNSEQTTEILRQAYQSVRLKTIVHTELEPRGLRLEAYHSSQQRLTPQITQVIDRSMSDLDMGVDSMVVGPNRNCYTIHTALNPGQVFDHTSIGHCAIGSGPPHALASLIGDGYTLSLDQAETSKLVDDAKKRSEIAPGVGAQTQSLVIPKRGSDEYNAHQ